jgi:hypothetical protein
MLKHLLGEQETADNEVVADEELSEEEKLLSGPQLDGQGLSQDDIDGLFD